MRIISIALMIICQMMAPAMTTTGLDSQQGTQPQAHEQEIPVMRKYVYFFRLLPQLGQEVAPGSEENVLLGDIEFINSRLPEVYKVRAPFESGQIKSSAVEVDGKVVIVMTFPEPGEVTDCLYVAWVPDGDHFATYMLEKTYNFDDNSDEAWVIGSIGEGSSHSNYGSIDYRPTEQQFVDLLRKKKLIKK